MGDRSFLGIDIGGTKILFALLNARFQVIKEIRVKTEPSKGEKHFRKLLHKHTADLERVARQKDSPITVVGVGSAGHVDTQTGSLRSCPNIPFLRNYPLQSQLQKLLSLPVHVMNDVQAGLYGELHLGAARGSRHAIGVFLGTGVGGALVINGELRRGAAGESGDIGNYLLHAMGPLAGSDRHGVLDDVVSRTAIAGTAAVFAAKQWAPYLLKHTGTDISTITADDLAEAIRHGDTRIEELVRSRSYILGIALSNLADFIDPDMVILGGGLVEAMPRMILEEVEKGLRRYCAPPLAKRLRIKVAALKDHAVAIGAAKRAADCHL